MLDPEGRYDIVHVGNSSSLRCIFGHGTKGRTEFRTVVLLSSDTRQLISYQLTRHFYQHSSIQS